MDVVDAELEGRVVRRVLPTRHDLLLEVAQLVDQLIVLAPSCCW